MATDRVTRASIPSLTGLRFVAALCVVSSHAIERNIDLQNSPPWLNVLAQTSAAGMTLFFVLSGFVIYYNYSNAIRGPTGLYNFFVARFARLYPLYAVVVTFDSLRKMFQADLPAIEATLPYYVTLIQSWAYHPINDTTLIYRLGSLTSLTWSISTEWFFYLSFPVICIAISSFATVRQSLWAMLLLASIAIATVIAVILNASAILSYGLENFGAVGADLQNSFYRWLLYFSPYIRLFEFTLGGLCASLILKLPAPSIDQERIGALLTAAAVAATVGLQWLMFGITSDATWHRIIQGLHMNFGFAPSAAVLIFCCARYKSAIARLLARRWFLLCGEASYSLYLLHYLAVATFANLVPLTAQSALIKSASLVIVVGAAIGLSLASWAIIEVPSRKWLRRALKSDRHVGLARPAE